jgi:hypothetical protein
MYLAVNGSEARSSSNPRRGNGKTSTMVGGLASDASLLICPIRMTFVDMGRTQVGRATVAEGLYAATEYTLERDSEGLNRINCGTGDISRPGGVGLKQWPASASGSSFGECVATAVRYG